ncbi:uncharacterized protein LAESUDRAFT_245413 [Laetiporus sulphureus 93-53]|uniref:Uncharacterized protein n=1 Tax=Laetiporus sulphureus 93-53 TaxID=1314785 RepID=A0A165DH93_9APHY|nr:uncharacterized protein LAESUDRAFT_245413 [Laetiporus sulphureus 93-53]KZT04874.1 hypothetical protein LAESUDRAFT_245413 [Laetiporus sulphureus 93-53]
MASVIPSATDISVIVVEPFSPASDTGVTSSAPTRGDSTASNSVTAVDSTILTNSTGSQTPPTLASQSNTPSYVLAGSSLYLPSIRLLLPFHRKPKASFDGFSVESAGRTQ